MAEQAIILIPDISGFTRFTTATEIDHAAHIITELLKIIVASNEAGFTLGEIEGDAVLFYRKGEPLRREQLIDQCLYIFSNFHRQLEVMERDRVCQCGACKTASNLTLKFIAHFGYVKEIRVAQFVKATGIDMIVAHRLLKNDVGSDEYILMTNPCCDAVGHEDANSKLQWGKSSQTYDAIGSVAYEFATLTDYKRTLLTAIAVTIRRKKRTIIRSSVIIAPRRRMLAMLPKQVRSGPKVALDKWNTTVSVTFRQHGHPRTRPADTTARSPAGAGATWTDRTA